MPNLPYASTAWTTHHEVGSPRLEYPIPATTEALVLTRTYEGPLATYSALAFGTLDPTYNGNANLPNAYLVDQGPLEPIEAAQVRYRRTYATVPPQHEEAESYAFTFPAYTASTTGNAYNITAASVSGANLILTSTTSGISPGNLVYYWLAYTYPAGSGTATSLAARFTPALAVAGANITVTASFSGFSANVNYTVTSGQVIAASPGRSGPRTIVVNSRRVSDYAYTTTPATDLLPLQPFRPIARVTGEDVTTLTTSNTLPTATAYSALVAAGGDLVAESTVERWRGDIYRRTTRYVTAL